MSPEARPLDAPPPQSGAWRCSTSRASRTGTPRTTARLPSPRHPGRRQARRVRSGRPQVSSRPARRRGPYHHTYGIEEMAARRIGDADTARPGGRARARARRRRRLPRGARGRPSTDQQERRAGARAHLLVRELADRRPLSRQRQGRLLGAQRRLGRAAPARARARLLGRRSSSRRPRCRFRAPRRASIVAGGPATDAKSWASVLSVRPVQYHRYSVVTDLPLAVPGYAARTRAKETP